MLPKQEQDTDTLIHMRNLGIRVVWNTRAMPKGCNPMRITENNITDVSVPEVNLLEKILDRDNMNEAYKRVKSNKGAQGVDGMRVDDLLQYLKLCGASVRQSIMEGKYKPNPVRRVEIPKEGGKTRPLGIPTVVDRVIQQSISQILSPIYEGQFSDNSFGFRPKRSTHDAIRKCQSIIQSGYHYVIDMDLEKFFDTVNQSKLIEVLGQTIKDGRVISLIHKYLRAGVVVKHSFKDTSEGVPQGGNLSPLLSNIMLNELDKELSKRGHQFVRYADDLMIFFKSKRAAERTLRSITRFIEKKLFLKVNQEKTVIDEAWNVKFLGISFYQREGETRIRIHPKSIMKMKAKIKELTSRSNGWGNAKRTEKLKLYIRGWINYFKIADIKSVLQETDKWMRRRIRAIYWKQWKKIKTKFAKLQGYGISEQKSWEHANSRKSYWRVAKSPILQTSLKNNTLRNLGYLFFYDYYMKVIAVN